MKPITEKVVTRRFRSAMGRHQFLFIKLTTLGARGTSGWPDYLVMGPTGRVAFVELKRPDGLTTPLQDEKIRLLRKYQARVFVWHGGDTLGDAQKMTSIVDYLTEKTR